jgi:stage V sporulation protein B
MIKDTFVTLATRISLFVLSMLVGISTARLLGPEGRGIYYLVTTYLGALILIGCLGLEVSNVYFGAKNAGERPGLFWNSLFSGTLLGTLLVVVGGLLFFCVPGALKGVPPMVLGLGLLALPCMMVSRFLTGLVLGSQDIVAYNALGLFERGLVLLLFLSLLVVWPKPIVAVAAYTLVQLLLAVVAFCYLLRRGLAGPGITLRSRLLKKTLRFGIKSQFANILQFLNYRLATFIINFFSNPAQVGIYSIALVLGESLWHLSNSVATVIMPRISADKSLQTSAALAAVSTRITLLLTALLAACVGLLAPWLIRLAFGSKYAGATPALVIMLPGIVVFSSANVLASYIAGTGYPQYNALVACVSLGVTIAGNLCFVPRWGINGASLASSISYLTTSLGSLYIYRRLSKRSISQVLVPTRQDWMYLRMQFERLYRHSE